MSRLNVSSFCEYSYTRPSPHRLPNALLAEQREITQTEAAQAVILPEFHECTCSREIHISLCVKECRVARRQSARYRPCAIRRHIESRIGVVALRQREEQSIRVERHADIAARLERHGCIVPGHLIVAQLL